MLERKGAFYCVIVSINCSVQMNKGGKFLEKLWCCVSRRVYQGNLVLSTALKM